MATQAELAEKLGVSQQFLSKWKRGRSGISKKTAERWADVLGVKAHKLVFSKTSDRPALLGLSK